MLCAVLTHAYSTRTPQAAPCVGLVLGLLRVAEPLPETSTLHAAVLLVPAAGGHEKNECLVECVTTCSHAPVAT